MAELVANIILKGKMECLTGIHIGGSKDKFEIGGVDSPVIRDPNSNMPYIPGSSLKGKMRSLLAFSEGVAENDPPKKNVNTKDPVSRVFGFGANMVDDKNGIGPTRLIVRDAYPDNQTIEMWKNLNSELLYTEYKPENTINRLTSAANPRFLERVVKGSVFNVDFIFGIYKIDDAKDEDYVKYFLQSLRLLEHSTLGGSGSRGYGKVSFKLAEPLVVTNKDYQSGSDKYYEATKDHDELEVALTLSDIDDTYLQEKIISKINA